MRVLVAGGAGYIGSNMTAMLVGAGHEPVVYDNLCKGHRQAVVEGAEFVEGDLGDYDQLVKALKGRSIEAVMHFAAFIEVVESLRQPLEFYRNNVSNTQNLLSAMAECGVEKFVFSSTAAVYGQAEEMPITENCPARPINPYGESKLAVERMCHWASRTGKVRYAALRYFNACGAGHNCTLGEDHEPESHLIPLVIKAALGQREDARIFGTDYATPDGTCIRDYIHVEDLCRAHLLALARLEEERELVYNLGNGTGYSVRQVIDTVKKVSGRDFKVTETARRAGDSAVLTSDASKATRELGWEPQMPELERIVETAWEWHSRHPKGYE